MDGVTITGFTNFGKMSDLKWTFLEIQKPEINSLDCLSLIKRVRSIKSKKAKTGVLKLAWGVTYLKYLSYVANT